MIILKLNTGQKRLINPTPSHRETKGENEMNYDSKSDTLEHIKRVSNFLNKMVLELMCRMQGHDSSKLRSPEKEIFDIYTPKLKATTYGSEEYKTYLKEMNNALDNHYQLNHHHPEHYQEGIDGMDLIDLVEMLCDWKAAAERHADGNIDKSIIINKDRFGLSEQLTKIFQNTVKRYF
jgi:hypothetical protein